MSHNLGHSFSPICLIFSEPSPNGEHSVDYSVCCIEIARCLARAPFGLVLQEIDIQSPMHAFDGPMLAYDVAQPRSVRRQARHIQMFLYGALSC